jgi:hypothetical protein
VTPLDYCFWGHLKALVYERNADSRAAQHCFIFVVEHVRNLADSIVLGTQSLLMHAEKCVATKEGHFKQLL